MNTSILSPLPKYLQRKRPLIVDDEGKTLSMWGVFVPDADGYWYPQADDMPWCPDIAHLYAFGSVSSSSNWPNVAVVVRVLETMETSAFPAFIPYYAVAIWAQVLFCTPYSVDFDEIRAAVLETQIYQFYNIGYETRLVLNPRYDWLSEYNAGAP